MIIRSMSNNQTFLEQMKRPELLQDIALIFRDIQFIRLLQLCESVNGTYWNQLTTNLVAE